MPKTNKVVQYGLENEVRELASAGFTRVEIADRMNIKNPNTTVSHMAIQRFLESDDVKKIRRELATGGDPADELRTEFRDKMYDLDDEMHFVLKETKVIYNETRKLLKQVKNTDDVHLQLNTLKQIDSSLKNRMTAIEQIRRDWNTLIEQGYRQFGRFDDAKKANYTQINNQLIILSNELCPKCRKRVVELITLKEDQDGR